MTRKATFYEAWSSGTAYLAGDIVSSGELAYLCISGHTNHVPPNATYWIDLGTTRRLPRWLFMGHENSVASGDYWVEQTGVSWTTGTNDRTGSNEFGMTTDWSGSAFKIVSGRPYLNKDCPPGILLWWMYANFTGWASGDHPTVSSAVCEVGFGTDGVSGVWWQNAPAGGGAILGGPPPFGSTAAKPVNNDSGTGSYPLYAYASGWALKYQTSLSSDVRIYPTMFQNSGKTGSWILNMAFALLTDWPSS